MSDMHPHSVSYSPATTGEQLPHASPSEAYFVALAAEHGFYDEDLIALCYHAECIDAATRNGSEYTAAFNRYAAYCLQYCNDRPDTGYFTHADFLDGANIMLAGIEITTGHAEDGRRRLAQIGISYTEFPDTSINAA